jgi:hypothetical protein
MTNPLGDNPFGSDPFGGAEFGNTQPRPPSFTPPPVLHQDDVNILATLSVVFAFVFAPAGALLGHLGLAQIRRTGQRGRDRALVGMVLSYAIVTVAVAALAVWATRAGTAPTRTAAPPTTTAHATATTTTSTTPPGPPTVAPADLAGLLPSLDEYKNIVGDQNLAALAPNFRPSHNPGDPDLDRPECWEALGGGEPNVYDMNAVVGYHSVVMVDQHDPNKSTQAGQVLLAFRDADAAQRQLAGLLSIWRQCGGSTMTLLQPPGSKLKPVAISMSVPADAGNGISTMYLTGRGPVLSTRIDRAIAAKNNVLIDADVVMANSDHGQQAVLDITNEILGKIPG